MNEAQSSEDNAAHKRLKLIYMNEDQAQEPPALAPVDGITTDQAPTTDVVKKENLHKLEESETPKTKKSKKLQGVGIRKPLYSKYETLFIIKAFKAISARHPNLVLIDLFKIVSLLFNEMAKSQGFKDRTADQLYQKYKRIQYGLNHGEEEFKQYFAKSKHNAKEWCPDFNNAPDDEILEYISFPTLDSAMNQVLGPPAKNTETTVKEESAHVAGNSVSQDQLTVQMRAQIQLLEEKLRSKEYELHVLREGNSHRDNEISFLKGMLKEELSFIRHRLSDR